MKIVNFLISSYILGTTDFLKVHLLVHKSLEDITKSETEGTKYKETERWDRERKEEEGNEAVFYCWKDKNM